VSSQAQRFCSEKQVLLHCHSHSLIVNQIQAKLTLASLLWRPAAAAAADGGGIRRRNDAVSQLRCSLNIS
jgi:hypothetical protein